MNTQFHYDFARSGLGGACGAGAATVHATVGAGMTTAAGALLMIPDPTMVTKIAAGILALGAAIQNFFFHPDCSKIAATAIVNQAETFAQQNLAAWLALTPSQKTPETQQAALMNFDNVWAQVVQACQSLIAHPLTGGSPSAGQNCISDRQSGACSYKTSPGPGCQPTQSNCWVQDSSGNWTLSTGGAAGSGNSCWNWFTGYRDPIANDPTVGLNVAAASAATGGVLPAQVSSAIASTGIDPTMLLIAGGIGAALLLVWNL